MATTGNGNKRRIAPSDEVATYLDRLRYAINEGKAKIQFQFERRVDDSRDKVYTNKHTILNFFPDEDVLDALRREILCLRVDEYLETVKDLRFPKRSEMWVFGKYYNQQGVYIKIRVELASTLAYGENFVFVMSFHFAEIPMQKDQFPYA